MEMVGATVAAAFLVAAAFCSCSDQLANVVVLQHCRWALLLWMGVGICVLSQCLEKVSDSAPWVLSRKGVAILDT